MRLNSLFTRSMMTALFTVAAMQTAYAGDFTFSGLFKSDDQVAIYKFNVTDAGNPVTLTTTSFATGGFDPILSLFREADGAFIADNDDISFPNDRDSLISLNLNPGSYLVALTQSDNFAVGPNIIDGFIRQGEGNYTGGPFLDPTAGQRTGSFGIALQNVSAAVAAPEPASVAFVALGALALAMGRGIRPRFSK